MSDITGDGIVYDKPEEIPVINSFTSFAQCVVHIRPDSSWKGKEFGFDWIRINDSGIKGDVLYYQNVGRYKNQIDENSTASGVFEQQALVFERLTRDYFSDNKRMIWKWKSTHGDNDQTRLKKESRFKYYIPVMTLLNGKKAELKLKVDMDTAKKAPDRIELSVSDNNTFILSQTEILSPANNSSHDLTITCSKETKEEQFLLLHAVYTNSPGEEKKSICGILRILPNHRRRYLKVLFVNMVFNDNNKKSIKGKVQASHIEYAKRILGQAMVELDYETITYSMEDNNIMRSDLIRNLNSGNYSKDDRLWGAVFNGTSLFKYLRNKNLLKMYEGHIIVVSLGATCSAPEGSKPGSTLPAPAFDIIIPSETSPVESYDKLNNPVDCTKSMSKNDFFKTYAGGFILMFNPLREETLVHEILHAAGFKHSFANSSPYTYRGLKTENIMDYSHNALPPIDRIALWQWQWEMLWDYCDNNAKIKNQRFEK